jgi:hypothetical protein
MSPGTKRKNWTKEALFSAVKYVRRGEMTYLKASKPFSVPKETVERCMKCLLFS